MKKIISTVCAASMLLSAAVFAPGASAAEAPALKADSRLITTKDGSAVCGTGGFITAADLAAEFEGDVTVKDPDGTELTDTNKVPTGSTVSTDGGSLGVLISGDSNADGNVNLNDVAAMMKKVAMWDVTIDETAADVNSDGKSNLGDVAVILKFIAKWDVKLGNMKVVIDGEPVSAAAEDSDLKLWFTHSTEKLANTDTDSTDDITYTISAAKNEIEDASLYIAPDKDYNGITISVTPFTNCYGETVDTEAYSYYYHDLQEYGWMPDALMPADSTHKCTVKAGKSQGFLIKAKTAADSTPGLYEAVVSIMAGNDEVKRAKVYLNVWDFTLDDSDAIRTSFGMSEPGVIGGRHGLKTAEENTAMYKTYYDFLLENRLNAFFMPYDPETPEADEYLNDPRVRGFVVYGGYNGTHATLEQLEVIYDKLSANEEWFEKGYFYVVDEPGSEEKIQAMYDTKALIDQYYPGGKQVVPVENDAMIPFADRIYDILKDTCAIWCPKMYAFTPESYRGVDGAKVFLTPEATAKYGTYQEIVTKQVETTDTESWWYYAGMPFEPYTTYHADSLGIGPRVSGWHTYMYDVTGLLYYAVDDYQSRHPLNNLKYFNGVWAAWGNGVLVYPGARYGVDGPIGSIRIEFIRDGIEDDMYLKMAERAVGREKVDEIVAKVTKDILDYTTDGNVLLAARAELAELIMSADAE